MNADAPASPALPRISVLTVCRNAEADICPTLESVVRQTYPNIEYIVIDGASTDGTLTALREYESNIAFLVSEPDRGIYDAMNKALDRATGDFVCFLNAGDTLANDDVFELLAPALANADLVYSDTYLIDQRSERLGLRSALTPHRLPQSLRREDFLTGMPFCHQSCLARRTLCPHYDLSYRVSADIDWLLKLLSATSRYHRSDTPIASFQVGGFSNTNWTRSLRERFTILVRHFGYTTTILSHLRILAKRLAHLIKGGTLRQ